MSDFSKYLRQELRTSPTVMTSFRLPQELRERYERMAEARGVPTSKIIIAALRFALDSQDYKAIEAAAFKASKTDA